MTACPTCDGDGTASIWHKDGAKHYRCPMCDGSGQVDPKEWPEFHNEAGNGWDHDAIEAIMVDYMLEEVKE